MKKDNKDIDGIVSEICQDAGKASRCRRWEEFNDLQWIQILSSQPQLVEMAEKYHAWSKLDVFDWKNLIIEQPSMMEAYLKNKTEDMTACNWLEIIKKHPQFLDICPMSAIPPENDESWGKYFTFGDWLELLAEQPQLEGHVPWNIEKNNEGQDESINGWLKLIAAHPHFAERLDWTRARNCTDGEIWKDLLTANREYGKYCPWDKIPPLEWWPIFKYCPQYFEKCNCPSEVPPRAWAYLLCQRPELAERFFRWSQLTVNEWASLLRRQPRLADECPCIDKVEELPDDEFDADGLMFPIGDETVDLIVDFDFLQRRMEHAFEGLQAQLASIEQTIKDKSREE